MGNHRFRLSGVIPNAFNKLKQMTKTSKTRHHNQPSSPSHIRQPSSYFLNTKPRMSGKSHTSSPSKCYSSDPPRRSSSKKKSSRKTIYKPSPKVENRGHDTAVGPLTVESSDGFVSSTESSLESDIIHEVIISGSETNSFASSEKLEGISTWSGHSNCKVTSSTTDIIIDMNEKSFARKADQLDEVDIISEPDIPPILTKPKNMHDDQSDAARRSFSRRKKVKSRQYFSANIVKEHRTSPLFQNSPTNSSTGIRLRANSPKISSKKLQACARKSASSNASLKFKNKKLSESFAVVKSSYDPQRDFKDSMMEMIVEYNIRASKDLEDLLACYLELNSSEYHDLIIRAFEQLWLDMTDSNL